MPARGPRNVNSRNNRSGSTSANALNWRDRSARFRRRLSGTSIGVSALVANAAVMRTLFRCPFVEAFGQAVDVFEPEANVDLHGVLDVVGRGRQVLQHGLLQQRSRGLVRGA